MRLAAFFSLCAIVLAQDFRADGVPYRGDTSGCGKTHDVDNEDMRSIESSGVQRNYTVLLPSNYTSDHEHPMFFAFHGASSTGLLFEADSRFSEVAGGYIMVYPDGIDQTWAGANYSEATVEEDLQLVWDLLTHVREEYCVDSSRIYATGMSIGGGFVNTIACNETVGREFAGFAPVMGSFYADNDENYRDCRPSLPVHILSMNAEEDDSVPFEGGEGSGGELPSIEDWSSRWADRLDCEGEPEEHQVEEDVYYEVRDCQENGWLWNIAMAGRNHSWPTNETSLSQTFAGDDPAPFNAAAMFVHFLGNARRFEEEGSSESGTTTSAPGATETGGETETSPADSEGDDDPDAACRSSARISLILVMVIMQAYLSI